MRIRADQCKIRFVQEHAGFSIAKPQRTGLVRTVALLILQPLTAFHFHSFSPSLLLSFYIFHLPSKSGSDLGLACSHVPTVESQLTYLSIARAHIFLLRLLQFCVSNSSINSSCCFFDIATLLLPSTCSAIPMTMSALTNPTAHTGGMPVSRNTTRHSSNVVPVYAARYSKPFKRSLAFGSQSNNYR